MFRKINQKIILILFVVLLALVIGVFIIDKQKNERTFKDDLVEVNADEVNQILLYPRSERGKEVKLEKENDVWLVINNGKKYPAEESAAASIISELNRATPESVASTSKERWKQYEVTDSLGTKVILKTKADKTLAELYVGKITFSQQRKATSFVRLADDKVVYGVAGYLAMSFNRDADSYRDKTVLKVKKKDVVKLSLTTPEDGTFELTKGDKNWMIGSEPADSAAVDKFLSEIQDLKHSKFSNQNIEEGNISVYKLEIDGNNMQQIKLTADSFGEEMLLLTSSQNNGNIFEIDDELKNKLFPSKNTFLK